MRRLTHLDLFSGFGGIALAARWAGFETVAFCEIDDYCQKVLRKNFGAGIVIHDDITRLDGSEYAGTIDVLTGGFPCQPYSIAGKRRGDSDDRALWREMLRVIENVQPTWVVGENVANFVNMALDALLAEMESRGYEAIPFVIPAAGVGAPHKRERLFMVAHAERGRCRKARKRRSVDGVRERTPYYASSSPQSSRNVPDAALQRTFSAQQSGQRRGTEQVCAVSPDPLGSGLEGAEPARGECSGRLPAELRQGIPDAHSARRSESWRTRTGWAEPCDGSWWAVESELGRAFDGLSPWLVGDWERGIPRVATGVKNRVDRLRGLGNAVVPQQIYPILAAIADIERGKEL